MSEASTTPAFSVGDVVQLKSGGYLMTVESVAANTVACVWFEDGDNVHRDTFRLEVIDYPDGDENDEDNSIGAGT